MEGTKKEITGMLQTMKDRIKQGKDFADLYTEDGVLITPGEQAAVGRDSISNVIKKYYDEDMADTDVYELEIRVLDDGKSAYSWHKFNLYNTEGKMFFSAICAMVWKKDEMRNEWLVVLGMFNGSP